MNDNEIERISNAVHALRPDWPALSIASLIRSKLTAHTRRDLAVALTWIACESDTKTPARVLENGPWWKATQVEDPAAGVRRPPLKHEECPRHPGEYDGICRGCAADRKTAAADDPATQLLNRRLTREEALAAMREAAAAAQDQARRSGVPSIEEEPA